MIQRTTPSPVPLRPTQEDEMTLNAAANYAASFYALDRFEEARSLLRKTIPVARRVLGEAHEITLGMRQNYAQGLIENSAATRRSPRSRDDARRDRTDEAARVWWCAPAHNGDRRAPAESASQAPRPRSQGELINTKTQN